MKFIELVKFPYYFACDDGQIYSKKGRGRRKNSYDNKLRVLKASKSISGTGYYMVNLPNSSSKTNFRNKLVHRLIVTAFKGEIPKGMTVSHLDGDKFNNKPCNLIIESLSDNHKRKVLHGTDDRGFKNSRALINEKQLLEIRKLLKEKEMTHKDIGNLFNVSRVFISKINSGHRYKQ
jgi:hypothetical protein